jgi:hypothetical protein
MGLISTTTSGILTGVSNKVGALTSVAKGVLCLAQVFTPQGLSNLTSGVLTTLTTYATSVVTGLTTMITSMAVQTVNNITGLIVGIVTDITDSVTMIKDYLQNLDDAAKDIKKYLLDQQNCNFTAAEIASCLLGDVVDDITNSVAKKISEGTTKLDDAVSDISSKILTPEKTISKYLDQAQSFANKAKIQQLI